MLVSNSWYKKEQATRYAPVLSYYALYLRDVDGKIFHGYYYCGHFYSGQIDITDAIEKWLIPHPGEIVSLNN